MVTMETTRMHAPTYDLRADPAWHTRLGVLADDFIVEGVRRCMPLLGAYHGWSPEPARGPANVESMLEALTFGVMWNLYAEERKGWNVGEHPEEPEVAVIAIPEGLVHTALERLLSGLWLRGELEEEARRIARFAAFFATLPEAETRRHLTVMARFGEWFRLRAREILGEVTRHVEEFRARAAADGEYRDDAALRARHEVEYHLNLLSALVLNCAWHDTYENTAKKLLVLPGCMRPRGGRGCRARKTRLGLACAGCTESCAVNRARRCAECFGVPTVVLEHQSAVFAREHAEAIQSEGCAVIGVACALSLQAGGWKAQDAGIPAQCLPLAYAGCARHWTEGEGVATDIDREHLIGVITGTNLAPGW
jgi:hypothetical protein